MAFLDLGKLKFNWTGAWDGSTAYTTDDVVFHNNQTWVSTADVAASQAEPQLNASWSLMTGGFNYVGVYSDATTYVLHDVVSHNSGVFMLTGIGETESQTNIAPGSDPGNDNWETLTPAPANNVLALPGDMVIRSKNNNNVALECVKEAGKGLNTVEDPQETYPSRAFSYEEVSGFGNTFNTPGSIPAITVTVTTGVQRDATTHANWIVSGEDRKKVFNNVHDGPIKVNIGDTLVFDNSATSAGHPMAIRVAAGGASVSTGTYTGEGTATVTWVTTGVAAGTYYYQCTNHPGMLGEIEVVDMTSRHGSSTENGSIEVARGKEYTITIDNVTNTGTQYDLFVDTATAGNTKKLTAAEGSSGTVTVNNGTPVTITFTPNATTPDTVYLRASSGGGNVEITVNDMVFVPSWGKASRSRSSSSASLSVDPVASVPSHFNTCGREHFIENANLPIPDFLARYGRGRLTGQAQGGQEQCWFINNNGRISVLGMNYNSSPYSYYSMGLGWHTNVNLTAMSESLVGWASLDSAVNNEHASYTKFYNDIDTEEEISEIVGTEGFPVHPKFKYLVGNSGIKYALTENGILYNCGYQGYGHMGSGNTSGSPYGYHPVRFVQNNGTPLTGTNYPRIKQVSYSGASDSNVNVSTGSTIALDDQGFVYLWGYNGYGQLANGGTTDDYHGRQQNKASFGGEDAESVYSFCDSYNNNWVITTTGKLFCVGYNAYGQLGVGNTNQQQTWVRSNTGSLANKRVLMVQEGGGSNSASTTYALCDDGTVHCCGYDNSGASTGTGNATNHSDWVENPNASTTYNSDNQKVVAMYCPDAGSVAVITDGGDSGIPKTYAWGTNYSGCCGIGTTAQVSTPTEIQIDLDTDPDGTVSGNITGTMSSLSENHNTLGKRVGKPVAYFSQMSDQGDTTAKNILLDDLGNLYAAGYWGGVHDPVRSNATSMPNIGSGTPSSFTPIAGQPEPMVGACWICSHDHNGSGFLAFGESGQVYGHWSGSSTSYYPFGCSQNHAVCWIPLGK